MLKNKRIAEAFVGEYASGKSEVSLNRALSLVGDTPVTLVDFDLVEPFYTLRPIQEELAAQGLTVLAWATRDTVGLGEAGSLIRPDMRWALYREGHVIMDVGYGVAGARKLHLVENYEELAVYVVLNIGRPMTASVADIVEYVQSIGEVHGVINNSHLGEETTLEFIQEGARIIGQAAKKLELPVICTTVDEKFAESIGPVDCQGNPVMKLKRYMDRSFW